MEMKSFYKDPLQAIYMTKYHNIKLQCENQEDDEGLEYANGEQFFDFMHSDITHLDTIEDLLLYEGRKVYIHPESYPLLSPQVGDIVEFYYPNHKKNNKQVCMIVKDACLDIPVYEQGLEIDFINKYPEDFDNLKIIQRNGKAWFSPEYE